MVIGIPIDRPLVAHLRQRKAYGAAGETDYFTVVYASLSVGVGVGSSDGGEPKGVLRPYAQGGGTRLVFPCCGGIAKMAGARNKGSANRQTRILMRAS